jgi:aryl-alcohol dehydrogenase-like predicted oxidoreductase
VRKRPLGQTGIQVSELALGTWGLSGDGYGPVTPTEVERVIERALSLGIDLFDTADIYGGGEMERVLGRLVPADKGVIVTKIGTNTEETPKRKCFELPFLRASIEKCQERIGREKLDIVLLHNPTMLAMSTSEPFDFLKELTRLGTLKAWGVSAGAPEVAQAAIRKGAGVIELAYNVFIAGDLHAMAGDLAESGVGVLARSVLAHGLLTGHWSAEREFYPGDHRAERWTSNELRERIDQLDALRGLVQGPVLSLRAAALRFVLANQLVSSAVLGPRSVAQLEQLVREAGEGPPYLRDTALAELAARLRSVGVLV